MTVVKVIAAQRTRRGGATVCGDYSVIVAAGRVALNVQDCDLES